MNRVSVGTIDIIPIIENPRALFSPDGFFPDATETAIDAQRDWMEPQFFDSPSNSFVLSVHSYLCRLPDKIAIIDCGAGNDKQNRRAERWNNGGWPYLDNLAAEGVRPEDVDLVLLTHLHVDHVGWNTRMVDGDWVPTFPNARYVFTATELENLETRVATRDDQYRFVYADSMKPVLDAGLADLVEMDAKIDEHVRFRPAPGHTPGQVLIEISAAGERAVATGDVLHHPMQAIHPHWNSVACELPELAKETRRAFLETTAGSPTVVLPAHFPPCRVVAEDGAFGFDYV